MYFGRAEKWMLQLKAKGPQVGLAGVGVAPGVDFGQKGRRSSNFGDIPFKFVEPGRSVREVGELNSYRRKPAEITRDLDGVDDWLRLDGFAEPLPRYPVFLEDRELTGHSSALPKSDGDWPVNSLAPLKFPFNCILWAVGRLGQPW